MAHKLKPRGNKRENLLAKKTNPNRNLNPFGNRQLDPFEKTTIILNVKEKKKLEQILKREKVDLFPRNK